MREAAEIRRRERKEAHDKKRRRKKGRDFATSTDSAWKKRLLAHRADGRILPAASLGEVREKGMRIARSARIYHIESAAKGGGGSCVVM